MTQPHPDDDDRKQRANLVVLGVVVFIVVLSVWALAEYKKSSDELNCFAAGRHNCAPVEIPPAQ